MADNMTKDRTDEAALERDVVRTQDEMGETVHKLEEKMNPRDISRSVMGDENTDIAREALEVTRQNPIPVALIAVGLIWLLATSRAPMITRITDRFTGGGGGSRRRRESGGDMDLRPRAAEPAPIGPSPTGGEAFDRRPSGPRI